MTIPRIYADFQKVDTEGFLILTAQGSLRDLKLVSNPKDGRSVFFTRMMKMMMGSLMSLRLKEH